MKRRGKFDVGAELRSRGPEPRAEFVQTLVDDVRGRGTARRSPWQRSGFAIALTGLMVVAIASFGGVGYASSAAHQAVKAVHATPAGHRVPMSAAQAQYGPTVVTKKKTGNDVAAAAVASSTPKATLPFTGLTLWIPLAAGLLLFGFGLLFRTWGRRRGSTA